MKRNVSFSPVLYFAGLVMMLGNIVWIIGGCTATHSKPATLQTGELQYRCTMPSKKLTVDQPVLVKLELINCSEKGLWIGRNKNPLLDDYTGLWRLRVFRDGESVISPFGLRTQFISGICDSGDAFAYIKPGGKLSAIINLTSTKAEMDKPGLYSVYCSEKIRYVSGKTLELPRNIQDDSSSINVRSNEVQFEITQRVSPSDKGD